MQYPRKNILASVIGTLMVGALSTVPAQAAGDSYVSAFGGYNSLEDPDLGTATGTLSSDADDGFGVGVAIGRWFDAEQRFRLELEAAYRENDISASVPGATEGEMNATTYMVNGYYDFDPGATFSPYLGVGAGLADVEAEDIGLGGAGALDDDDSVFAYQFIGGVSYSATPNADWFGELRYLATDDPEFGAGRASEYETVSALAGIRFRF